MAVIFAIRFCCRRFLLLRLNEFAFSEADLSDSVFVSSPNEKVFTFGNSFVLLTAST